MYTVTDENKSIKRATVSDDSKYFAFFCEGGAKVYLGKVEYSPTIEVLDFGEKGIVNGIRWRPETSELAIVGGDSLANTSFFILHNAETKE